MIPAPFDYEVADSLDAALSLLAGTEGAKPLAGGHSLIPAMKLRAARPPLLVDIGPLRGELSYVRDVGEWLEIGALTRHKALRDDPLLQEHCPIVSHTARQIGDPQVRHRGTIGGSLAHGDPASDLPAVILALEAELVVRGRSGERVVPAREFFRDVWETAVEEGELLTEVRVPKLGASTGWSYVKQARRAQDWATVGVAVVLSRDNGTIADSRIGLVNMGGTPLRATGAEAVLTSADAAAAASARIPEGTMPPDDVSASSEFRAHLATVIGRRAIEEALAR